MYIYIFIICFVFIADFALKKAPCFLLGCLFGCFVMNTWMFETFRLPDEHVDSWPVASTEYLGCHERLVSPKNPPKMEKETHLNPFFGVLSKNVKFSRVLHIKLIGLVWELS